MASYYSQVQDSRNRGGTEPKKKLKKLRSSVKLSKLPSMKSSTRFQHLSIHSLSSRDDPIESPNASPNSIKATSCSDSKESFQAGSESEERTETPVKKMLNKSRSSKPPPRRRPKSRFDQPSIECSSIAASPQHPSGIKVSDALPNYLKATSCSHGKKALFQAGPCSSESSFGSNDLSASQSSSVSHSLKSVRTLSRTSSLRILINKSSFKSKRPSVKNHSEVSSHDSSIERATCSSTLKDYKFPQRVEQESESKRDAIMKVCHYNHCSMNGHCHAPVPPPKSFVSQRRRALKIQKSMKLKSSTTIGVKQDVSGTPSNLKDKIKLDKSSSEETEIDWKGEDTVSSQLDRSNDTVSTCNEEASKSNSELCDTIDRRTKPDDSQRATEVSSEVSSATVCDPLERDGEFLGGSTAARDFEPNPTTDETSPAHSNKEKHLSLWHLIHRHMVSGLAAEASPKALEGTDKQVPADDDNTLRAQTSSGLSPNFSDSDHNMVSQDIELRKIYAIKLVREAIEKILLPEVPDQLSDNNSITGDNTPKQDQLDNNYGKDEQLNILTSSVSVQDSTDHDEAMNNVLSDPKETRLAADSIHSAEQRKSVSKVRNISDKQAPKSWSNLKKLILLKRFVKALENVRKFKPRKPQILPLERDTEAGKVCLRHQVMGERRSAEESMIDYALQQVVSKLAPTQKRKVALLVEAFETIVPHPGEKDVMPTSPELKEINQNGCCDRSEMSNSDSEAATEIERKAKEVKDANYSAYVCDTVKELSPNDKEQNRDLELENKCIKGFTPSGDSEPNATANETYKTELKQEKHISLWHMIHKHMASDLAAEAGIRELDGADRVMNLNDTITLLAPKSSGSFGGSPASDQLMGTENHNSAIEDIEIRKIQAIKMVREAIEKILLPEVQDQSSDDQYINGDVISDQELLEKNQGDGGEPSISSSQVSAKDGFRGDEKKEVEEDVSQDVQEKKAAADKLFVSEDEKITSSVGNKSNKQTPKSWSNLKKLILLKRFIKALEKVRKFNPRKPQSLPLESDAEAEKVRLRHQVMEEKKNTEEWMLDYALRQVVSELAPTQKRKVALLVKAFETVVPPSEDDHIEVTKASLTGLEMLANEKDQQEFDEDTASRFNLGIPKSGSELHRLSEVNGAPSHISESPMVYKMVQTIAAREGKNGDADPQYILQGSPPPGDCPQKVELKSQLDKQKHIRMWHLIYQHVATGIAAKVGTQLLLNGDDEEEQADDGSTLREIRNGSCHDCSKEDGDSEKENHDARFKRIELSKSDAVKLVQESIDELLLPEIQDDSSDAQSTTSDIFPDQELLDKNHCEDEVGEGILLDQKEPVPAADSNTAAEEEMAVLKEGEKWEQQKSKNWSKLQKLILLKRSIKALQKVRKFNHQAPQHPTMEAENVDLRRQMMDERKKAEQWMIDYALQHIVTKLTPARKRRVSLLVEAFEAVVPLPEI